MITTLQEFQAAVQAIEARPEEPFAVGSLQEHTRRLVEARGPRSASGMTGRSTAVDDGPDPLRGALRRAVAGQRPDRRRDRPARLAAGGVGLPDTPAGSRGVLPRRAGRRRRVRSRRSSRSRPSSSAHGSAGVAVLEELLAAARERGVLTILDVKRGDIGSTMGAYAQAHLLPGAPLEADAITVSPYLGTGSLDPGRAARPRARQGTVRPRADVEPRRTAGPARANAPDTPVALEIARHAERIGNAGIRASGRASAWWSVRPSEMRIVELGLDRVGSVRARCSPRASEHRAQAPPRCRKCSEKMQVMS